MNITASTMETRAVFSDDGTHRYLLEKVWEPEKPRLGIIMLAPSTATDILFDSTTLQVLNNVSRLGYGSVSILNLFARLDDFALKHAEDTDEENLKMIAEVIGRCDTLVYAPGVGKAGSRAFQMRQEQVLQLLKPFEDKLFCISNEKGNVRLMHPLCPQVRVWKLSPFQVSELLPEENVTEPAQKPQEPKRPGRPRKNP